MTHIYANSVDPDETAHYEPSHLDLHYLLAFLRFWVKTPIDNNGHDQVQRWKRSLQKVGVKGLKIYSLLSIHSSIVQEFNQQGVKVVIVVHGYKLIIIYNQTVISYNSIWAWHSISYQIALRQAKGQIRLRIHSGLSESSLSAWKHVWSVATHRVSCEYFDQTPWICRRIWVFPGRKCSFVGNAVPDWF